MSKNTQISELINYLSVDGSGNIVITGSLIGPAGATYATQSYVTTAISNLVNAAPTALDTLAELSAALNNDASFATTVTNSLATKLNLSGGTLSGQLSGTNARFFGSQAYYAEVSADSSGGFIQAYNSSTSKYQPYLVYGGSNTTGFSLITVNNSGASFSSSVAIGTSSAPTFPLDLVTSTSGAFKTIAQFQNTDYTTGNQAFIRVRQWVNSGGSSSSYFGTGQDGNLYIIANNSARGGDLIINAGNGNATFAANIGIGTTPDNTYQGLTIYGTNPSLRLKASASGSWTWTEYVNSSGVNTFSMGVSHSTPVFVIRAGAGLDNPHFALSTAGNVGIGTVAPVSKLDINGGNIRLGEYLNSASSLIGKQRAATGVFYSSVEFYSTTGEDVIIFNTHLSGVSAGERARITGAGDMGIGTTSPLQKLDVRGSILMSQDNALRAGTAQNWIIGQDSGTNRIHIGSMAVANNIDFDTSVGTIVRFASGGNVGINTTDPATKFDVNGHMGLRGSNYFYFGHNSGSIGSWTTRMYANGAEHRFNANGFAFTNEGYGSSVWLQILSNGYVGLGTTSPGALLDLGPTGGRKLLVYNGGTGNQSGFGVDLDGVSYGAGAFFAYGGSDIGRYVIGSYDGTTFRSKLTVHGSGAVAIAAGVPTYPKLNVGGSLQTKRTIHSWYEATPPDGTSYWHIKTNMWGGGSPYGNTEYTMSLFKGYFYTYSAMVREGMVGFHNWSGSIYNTASNGNLFANVYVSSDGYVVLVVNCGGGSYNSLTIDWYQAYEYPFRDKTVIAATSSGSTSGVY